VQALGAMTINTHGQALLNNQSGSAGIIGLDTVTLTSGSLNNQGGYLGSKNLLTVTTGQIDNSQYGNIVGQGAIVLNASGLNNAGGVVSASGNLSANLGSGALDNRGGLMHSGATLAVNAGSIDNSNTQGAGQGMEGFDVALTAPTINNNGGVIRADNQITLTTASLDNTNGLISSANSIVNNATTTANGSGTIIAGHALTMGSTSISGLGDYLSRGDLTFNYGGDFNNNSQLLANGNLTFNSTGTVTNSGKIGALATLNLSAANIDNQGSGEISAVTTNINVSGTLTNSGLIDGGNTSITAGTLNNTGSIYGDDIALYGGTLNNSGTGAIASRNNMDLGVSQLNNTEGALIYSSGNLTINAGSGVNASATIEAAGNLTLNAGSFTNSNNHFSSTTQVTGNEHVIEYRPSGSVINLASSAVGFNDYDSGRLVTDSAIYPIATFGANPRPQALVQQCDDSGCTTSFNYAVNDPIWALFNVAPPGPAPTPPINYGDCIIAAFLSIDSPVCTAYGDAVMQWNAAKLVNYTNLDSAITAFNGTLPARSTTEDWYIYDITRTTTKTVVLSSAPAQLRAGGNMSLSGAITNDKSQIIAGGTISGIGSVRNIAAAGSTVIADTGTVTFSELVACGWFGDDHCRENGSPGAYSPGARVVPRI